MMQVIRCKQCKEIIMGFKYPVDPSRDKRIGEHMIDQTVGQGPWYKTDPMFCRKCGTEFTMEQLAWR